jgi:hypothetical protein
MYVATVHLRYHWYVYTVYHHGIVVQLYTDNGQYAAVVRTATVTQQRTYTSGKHRLNSVSSHVYAMIQCYKLEHNANVVAVHMHVADTHTHTHTALCLGYWATSLRCGKHGL